jgi:hypothetical protein
MTICFHLELHAMHFAKLRWGKMRDDAPQMFYGRAPRGDLTSVYRNFEEFQ